MNAFVRQVAVLSVLWTMCEMLLPDGKHQQMVRMTASLLVMTALLSTAGGWFGGKQAAQTVMMQTVERVSEASYQRTALTAMANQVESYCVRMAARAGYQAGAIVYLTMDGAVDHIALTLEAANGALVSSAELVSMLAEQLGVDEGCIWLSVEDL